MLQADWKLAKQAGLSVRAYAILAVCRRVGFPTSAKIKEITGLDHYQYSRAIREIENHGGYKVSQRRSAGDRRKKIVSITRLKHYEK